MLVTLDSRQQYQKDPYSYVCILQKLASLIVFSIVTGVRHQLTYLTRAPVFRPQFYIAPTQCNITQLILCSEAYREVENVTVKLYHETLLIGVELLLV